MSQWTQTEPGAGSPADIRAAAGRRRTDAETARTASANTTTAGAVSGAGWQGLAATALHTATGNLAGELTQLAGQAEADAGVLQQYANAVETIQQRQNALASRHHEVTTRLQNARRSLSYSRGVQSEDTIAATNRTIDACQRQLTGLTAQLTDLATQRSAADNTAIIGLTGLASRGTFSPGGGAAGGDPASLTLQQLQNLSETDLATLLTLHPDLTDRLLNAHTPEQTASWWVGLTPEQQQNLTLGAPALIGALGGIPPMVRIAANRLNASRELAVDKRTLKALEAPHITSRITSGQDSADTLDELRARVAYLERAVTGQVQLYLWQPDKGAVIEMAGDPRTAKSALFVLPGTNASISEFTGNNPTTQFASWQVANSPTHSVVAFTVLTGPMPHLPSPVADLWSNGPQNNAFATARAPEYANFQKGVFASMPGVPTLSYEHSYATAIGSAAEAYGGTPTVRVLAAGVGAMIGYQPVDGIERYAIQAPNDINRYYAGLQYGEVGFGVAPENIPGIHILDSGMQGLPITPTAAARESLLSPLIVGAQVPASVENHVNLMSDDLSVNNKALQSVRKLLESSANTPR